MQALKFAAKEKQLKLIKTDIPKVQGRRDVVIQVKFAGVCGTDLHILQGEFPCRQDRPFTPGHEFGGIVVAIGDDVTCVKVGDRAVVDPNHGCDVCDYCRAGNPHFCKVGGLNDTIGMFRDGGWAEYARVPDVQVHKLPEAIAFEQSVLCEPLSCIAHAWDKISPVTVGQKILITGAGIIGNLFTAVLHLQGHRKVTISEPNAERLQVLKEVLHEFDFVTPDILRARNEDDPEYLFDLVIDCSGNYRAIEQGFGLLQQGGKLCIFGVAPPEARVSLPPFDIFKRELTVLGVQINPFSFPKALGLAEALGNKYLNYKLMGIKPYKLNEYEIAIKDLKSGSIAKAVFQVCC